MAMETPRKKRRLLSERPTAASEISSETIKKLAAESANADANANANGTTDTDNADVAETSTGSEDQRRSLFIRSLPTSTTTQHLVDHFSQSYPIKHAVAVTDPSTKSCKGFGFVTFADPEIARAARDELQGSQIQGRKIQLDIAKPRHRDFENGENPAKSSTQKQKPIGHPGTQPPPRLIVRNLPWSVTESEQLAVLFRSYGKVKQAYLPRSGSGALRGFGFVVLRGRKNAERAIEGVNGREVDGRRVAVDWAVDKETWESHLVDESNAADEASVSGADEDAGSQGEGEIDSVDDEDDEDGGIDLDRDEEMLDAEDDEVDEDDEDEQMPKRQNDTSCTVFIRNLPFETTDDDLKEHFETFGPVRYARTVMDHDTGRSRGTGFVCFYSKEVAGRCVRGAAHMSTGSNAIPRPTVPGKRSIIQDEHADFTGRYTLNGRVLMVVRAVEKSEAEKYSAANLEARQKQDKDTRHLYLLSEGTISSKSPLYQKLSPSEIAMRDASAKQRKSVVEKNPSLRVSLTRLSVRNIPRFVDSKALKALAREAVVGFATDVKQGNRQAISKEELLRDFDEMKGAEQKRKLKQKGIVKQAKIVFESKVGGKIEESSGAGRSRGYGFIEYHSHRSALMGLRWLNGHAVKANSFQGKGLNSSDAQDRNRRLIVEFALDNAQVVKRRNDRPTGPMQDKGGSNGKESVIDPKNSSGGKRKHDQDAATRGGEATGESTASSNQAAGEHGMQSRKRRQRRQRKKAAAVSKRTPLISSKA